MNYFAVYIGVEGIPSDKVELYLRKAKEQLTHDKEPDERFFFLADPTTQGARIERL